MRFKITKAKAANVSNRTAIAKLTNAGDGDFGRIGIIHCLEQNFPWDAGVT